LAKQQRTLLPVPYFHLVFTLPHVLNPLIQQNQRVLYVLLFQAVSQTLLEFGQNRFGVQLGITAVLHTWSQTLLDHYHLHCIVTGGGLSADGSKWVSSSSRYLFAVRALSKVFRAKFCAGLEKLYHEGKLQFHGKLAALASPSVYQQLLLQAVSRKWVVYSKRPFAGPRQVLAYLSRYTHRVALSPRRLLTLDPESRTVTFSWKDYANGCKRKTMRLELGEFVRRFCLHLLPERFVKIRHFGFLGNRQRKLRVAHARALLNRAVPGKAASLPLESGRACPHCGSKLLVLVEIVPRVALALAGTSPRALDSS
jgi:hypothetical protein